jgi:hypothetical protein
LKKRLTEKVSEEDEDDVTATETSESEDSDNDDDDKVSNLWGSVTHCAFPPPWPSIFPIILFLSTTLLTGMTGSSLNMQWPLTSQSQDSFLK